MTFKERLMQKHPEYISCKWLGECRDCPCDYGYEEESESIKNCITNHGKGCDYCWNREMPEGRKADMKKRFTMNDLKDGNMLKTRAGKIFIWLSDIPRELDYVIANTSDNLKNSNYDEFDIIEVRDSSSFKNVGIKGLFRNYDKMPVIWKEEPVTKDVSLEELNAILKEKFPDVDEFNLPIKE